MKSVSLALVAVTAAFALAGCSLTGGGGSTPAPAPSTSGSPTSSESSAPAVKELTVVTHDSFALSKDVLAQFTEKSGYTVKFVAPGDAGALVNQLILTKDSPLGDVVYGVDNTFAGRALNAGVFTAYNAPDLSEQAQADRIDDSDRLTPIDRGDVCVNVDHEWFKEKNIAEPKTFDDLTKPEYKNQLVVENPASSSPGLAWLLATVGQNGENGWQGYWTKLKDNGVKVVDGWETAYTVDFSGSEGKGSKPLVVSYSSSPSAEVPKGSDTSRTGALLDTCFRQVEYAGVLTGAKNEPGAQAFIDFMLSDAVQKDLPGQMYMYPVNPVPLPADWEKFAPLSPDPKKVDPTWLADNRDKVIKEWSTVVIG